MRGWVEWEGWYEGWGRGMGGMVRGKAVWLTQAFWYQPVFLMALIVEEENNCPVANWLPLSSHKQTSVQVFTKKY